MTVSFGNVSVGNSSTQSVSIINTGTASVNVSQASISGSAFSVAGGNASFTIPVGQTSTMQVQFAPKAAGSASGTLSMVSDASNSPLAISLSGMGTQATLGANPSSVNFGNVSVGGSSSVTVTLTNSGSSNATISAASASGTGFSISGLSANQVINAGQSATFSATFAPTGAGATTGSISITSDAPGSPTTIALSGTGTQAQISATPSSVSFGNVTTGTNNSQTITLRNAGNATLTFSQVTVSGTGFSITGLSTSTTISAGGNMTFNAIFAPTSSGAVTGTIQLATNGVPAQLTINLSGTGVAPTLSLSANPSSLSFGNVTVNTSTSLTTTLTNNGNANVTISGLSATGAGFSASGVSNGTILTPNQSATLTVTFAPTVTGSVTGASVTVTSDATNSPTTVALSGAGTPTHSATLSWTASTTSTVASYNVYRAASSGGYTNPLNSSPVTATGYTDTTVQAGQTYFFVVTAVDQSGAESTDSNEVQTTVPTP